MHALEKEILKALYNKNTNPTANHNLNELEFDEEGMQRRREIGFYLLKLERFSYIRFEGEALTKGGQSDPIFKNNIAIIWWENIHITEKGNNQLKEEALI
ncbi:hypothetical protein [Fictibacillus sp. FJAT-27399]|uniref:hypothetical protein n=1 Tax=Fictibacillus sp. FJAT-27399 TaxID=1729689 RepID=UPI000780E781|nr:hypothetical protein [Fictibacillus sp. FJAT-27399]